jgi:signal peptidase I
MSQSPSTTPTPPAKPADVAADEDVAEEPANALIRFWRNFRSIIILIVVLFAVRSSIADWNDVPTGSMTPTILDGDRIFVNKLAYDLKVPFTTTHIATWGGPQHGDIVVFFSPDTGIRLVKRCVAIPGDTLLVQDDHLYVNGQEVPYGPPNPKILDTRSPKDLNNFTFETETLGKHVHPIQTLKYLDYGPRRLHRDFGPVTVPPGKYVMMGDNRDNSADSRYFNSGPFVDRSAIVGKAIGVAVSVDLEHHWLPRWSRFFTKLP